MTPCHKQGLLTLVTYGWPGQGSWEVEFGYQDLQSSTEMDAMSRTVPYRNECVVMAVADILNTHAT